MCESTAYSTDGSLIMEDVLLIKIDGNQIDLTDILNQKKTIKGHISEIDLDKHGIYINLEK
ncbi:MAG: CooT family nickel-binding protein [Methanobacteriaceae archaeon]|jgi:predicted RNA-binding protein|nr:CooT family nickel-binding protein [Methanobacteriaceae archaeon]MDO9043951.1 CooT family nickel-binding protein [Methanobacteriaceae archaeon]MDO9627183.1 CooT family nickel-binding protein [Methanobacteriaceae archaeon]MDP2837357.1 CooT family nickel-binding protein [Methanobacteriaceae archaeon]MDP3035731.1 CooT family nickel-binding protein [Methanobacteriaceae archaeon]